MQIPLTICGFYLNFAVSTYNLRIPHTVADSATAHCNYTYVLLFVGGFHKLFWIPQKQVRIPQICLFLELFWVVECFKYLFVESKQQRRCTVWNAQNAQFGLVMNSIWFLQCIGMQKKLWLLFWRHIINDNGGFCYWNNLLFLKKKYIYSCFHHASVFNQSQAF